MNRTLFRGVSAAILATALVGGSVVAGTALAATTPQPAAPAVASVNADTRPLARQMDTPQTKPHKAHKAPHVQRRASRAQARLALTGSPQMIAHALVLRRGWSDSQWGCLDRLWTRESNWQVYAQNRSGAYGIPQSLPAAKMAAMGSDWRTNPITQIRWGLWYIANSYGTPCTALEHSNNYNYY